MQPDPMRDPVCGMTARVDTPNSHTHEGVTYRFCSARCLAKFREDPSRYLDPGKAEPLAPTSPSTRWTCPMHPEIVRDEPGPCPICGMALEPIGISADDDEPRARRHDAPFLDQPRAHGPGLRRGDGRDAPGLPRLRVRFRPRARVLPARARHAGRALGRLAVLRPRLHVAPDATPQHVHADRDRDRRGVGVQRGGDAGARGLSGIVSRHGRMRSPSTSRPRP